MQDILLLAKNFTIFSAHFYSEYHNIIKKKYSKETTTNFILNGLSQSKEMSAHYFIHNLVEDLKIGLK